MHEAKVTDGFLRLYIKTSIFSGFRSSKLRKERSLTPTHKRSYRSERKSSRNRRWSSHSGWLFVKISRITTLIHCRGQGS